MAKKNKPKAAHKMRVYLGPTMPAITNGVLFSGEYPRIMKLALERHPVIEKLIVPCDQRGVVLQNLKNPHSIEAYYYKKIQEGMKKND